MSEVWLRSNHRAYAVALALPIVGLLAGACLVGATTLAALHWLGWGLVAVSLLSALWLAWQLMRPRIARRGDELLFYLGSGAPLPVPLTLVEGFLLGQGASYLRPAKPEATAVSTVVVRLADRATEYAQREVKPALGSWCNHYVTIRGTWCEPLSVTLVTRLNEQLAAAQAQAIRTAGATMKTRLLVSVRDAEEAVTALAAGASLIDLKEPSAGALGAVELPVMREIVRAVAGRVTLSAALGELLDGAAERISDLPPELQLVKFGLAGCANTNNWTRIFADTVAQLPATARGVAVIYADWTRAAAPAPAEVIAAAQRCGCRAVLVDTWQKEHGGLLDLWNLAECAATVRQVRAAGLLCVLAGSLNRETIAQLLPLVPDYVAVRGAVCGGRRNERLMPELARELADLVNSQNWQPIDQVAHPVRDDCPQWQG